MSHEMSLTLNKIWPSCNAWVHDSFIRFHLSAYSMPGTVGLVSGIFWWPAYLCEDKEYGYLTQKYSELKCHSIIQRWTQICSNSPPLWKQNKPAHSFKYPVIVLNRLLRKEKAGSWKYCEPLEAHGIMAAFSPFALFICHFTSVFSS